MLRDWGADILEGFMHGGAYFRNFTLSRDAQNVCAITIKAVASMRQTEALASVIFL